jgi:hypothetical protein
VTIREPFHKSGQPFHHHHHFAIIKSGPSKKSHSKTTKLTQLAMTTQCINKTFCELLTKRIKFKFHFFFSLLCQTEPPTTALVFQNNQRANKRMKKENHRNFTAKHQQTSNKILWQRILNFFQDPWE